jgi:NitT/TauT family transport system substrate-binding protein
VPTTAAPTQPASVQPSAPSASAPALADATAPTSAGALIPIRIAYPAPAGAQAPIWVAYEQGLLREQGLDVELVFLSGTRTDQGVVSGETPIGFGVNVIPTRLSGADLIAIASVFNRMTYEVYGRPSMASPQDLRGKTMVATLPGALTSLATLVTLGYFGLEPHRDVSIQPTQGTAEQLTLMANGLADASLFSPPASFKAAQMGLTRLANMAEVDIPFVLAPIGTTASYMRDHPDIVRRFLRAYVASVALARRDRETTKALIGKYTDTDDMAILEDTYQYYRSLWGRPDFRVQPDGVASILRVLDMPGADTARPEEFIDNRFVDELHDSGFIRQSGTLE